MISCVAIIGASNNPLYVRAFEPEQEPLEFHYIAHVALDVIEEKLRTAAASSVKDDMYLGFLGPIEDFRVFGYVTNTMVKLVAITPEAPSREAEMRSFFGELHKLYVNVISNPFATLGERITSQQFDTKVYNLVSQHNTNNPLP